mgnify:CR=1 FL=1
MGPKSWISFGILHGIALMLVVARLAAEIQKAMDAPDVKERFATLTLDIEGTSVTHHATGNGPVNALDRALSVRLRYADNIVVNETVGRIYTSMRRYDDALRVIGDEVADLCRRFPIYPERAGA